MNTVTVSVPAQIAQKYKSKVVDYKDLLDSLEEYMWIDLDLKPAMKLEDFYTQLKGSDGGRAKKSDR